jgi:UDP-galactopyranose mutase
MGAHQQLVYVVRHASPKVPKTPKLHSKVIPLYSYDVIKLRLVLCMSFSRWERTPIIITTKYLPPLVVFSHLRWDFVYQRPQQLLSRLAEHRQVVFIEEPIHNELAQPHWEITNPAPNVLVCRPHLPIGGPGFNDEQLPLLRNLVTCLFSELEIGAYALWIYTPMALPLAQSLPREPLAVVYDCMDELSAFKFAPLQLVERERALMKWADVVFTGGPSLYRAKKGRHANLHCFPSSVDVDHFRRAQRIPEAADQAYLLHPRFGWFGVIDERMDLAILTAFAQAHPEWQIVMIGPVVKIDPSTLPRHPNLHYLGPRTYAELPSYLAGWEVCIQPFARNESTRFISPTKTLEYMAADLPIVSTPITDVAEPYGQIVYVGATPGDFVAACEQALVESPEQKRTRIERGRQVLARTSWNSTAGAIEALIQKAMADRCPVAV